MEKWLDNYNDSKASAPKGFQGDGYSNKGRNYSPAWGGSFQMGGSVYPVNYVPQAQDGYQMGTYFDEDARERESNMMEETYDDYNTGMTGMMKSKMATQAALGNPGAKRMMSNMPAKYIFTGNERFSDGTPAEGAGAYGSHYISNRDNYVYPNLQDNGEGTLNFIPNASPSDREAMRFENPGEADYFANHYKEVAPMMKHYFNKLAMGGSIPGAVGFTYARTQGAAPSNGKYAKKTMASAQNGKEMQYYQQGLDFKPKSISKNGSWLSKYEDGGIIKDDRGQWDHPGEITRISGGNITMKRDPRTGKPLTQPILGIADTGEQQWMYPGEDYNFEGAEYVDEYPKGKRPKKAQNGMRQEQKGLQNLDNLTNFTNYNKPQPGGWLNKYN